MSLSMTIDTQDEDLPATINASINNVDLALLKNDLALKDQDMSGIFTAQAMARGNLKDTNSLQGQGSLMIQNGNIWQMNLLKDFGKFLLSPNTAILFLRKLKAILLLPAGRWRPKTFH